MITSSGPVSVAENWSQSDLIKAGWSAGDLAWEALAETVAEALGSDDVTTAIAAAGEALKVAREQFDSTDPRLGTSLALSGAASRAGAAESPHLFAEAAEIWSACGPWIAAMTAPRSARSSLFHMRMEQRHLGTYEERRQIKWRGLAEDGRARVEALSATAPKATRFFDAGAQWRRERPAMLNDTRKLMAAVLLLPPMG
jgi:hypothetical protein